ncbi:hypothetical protein ATG_13360 [Desulfurococcaceae archaeon AG1]|nr:hypothetical protein ATG_13360 [Desulfurococcaceae archaeon AG1]
MLRERLREILSKPGTQDLLDLLEELISELIRRFDPIAVIVAGSLARSRFVRGLSDIDILVITQHEPPKHERFLLRAVKDVDVEITVYSLDEVRLAIKQGNQFITDAIKNGIKIYDRGLEHQL